MKRSTLSAAILGTIGLSTAFSVLAAPYPVAICAGSFNKTLSVLSDPTQTPIPMWGYALANTSGTCDGVTYTTPGPRIDIPDGYDGLEVSLTNTLVHPTSIVIPGTVKVMAPMFFTPAGETIPRVRSFDTEAAANGGTATYTWSDLGAGSYMYHSGTHPQRQVQMGMYGAVTNDVVQGLEAYPGITYSQDIVMFYSEIDRALHNSISTGDHSSDVMLSTIGYKPKYFQIDIDPTSLGTAASFEFNDLPTLKFTAGTNPLIRFFNAGQNTHVPTVFNAGFDILAEDGKPYSNAKKQYTVELPALKTRDAVLNINGRGVFPGEFGGASFRLTDSSMGVSNPAGTSGAAVTLDDEEIANGKENGMVLKIEVLPGTDYVAHVDDGDEPVARRDSMTVQEGGSIVDIMSAALANDDNAGSSAISILSYPRQGVLSESGGIYTYQHKGNEKGQDSMVYALTNASGESDSAGIMINVAPQNDDPVANDDSVTVKAGQLVEIRVLNNDEDVDSKAIRVTGVGDSSLGTLSFEERVILFQAGTTAGSEVVAYTIDDFSTGTASAEISLTVVAATNTGSGIYTGGSGSTGETGPTGLPPEAIDDTYSVFESGTIMITEGQRALGVLGNDSMDATADTSLVEYPEHGSILMREDGTFEYTHDGSEDDDDRFVYEAFNAHGSSKAEVVITVQEKMDAPHVNNDRANTKLDTPILIDLLRNDKDKDSAIDPNGIVITEMPGHGTVEILTEGTVRYTPDAGYTGKDSFRYRLKDSITGELSKRAAKVKVKVK